MITDKDLLNTIIDRWVNSRVAEFTRNRPFITPLTQRYVHNMITPYKSYLKGFFNEEGKLDEELVGIIAYPFNEHVDPIKFSVLDTEFRIENGNIYFEIGDTPAVINKKDVMELLTELEKMIASRSAPSIPITTT